MPAALDAWGTHPSWSRLLGSPVLYEQIEERLTELIGSEDSLVLPTITHIHMSVIPLLAASGTIFLDERAHKTIYDGCQAAKARGAAVRRFRFEDPDHLDQLMAAERDPNRLVCMDGVNSMTGNPPDLRRVRRGRPAPWRAALRRRRPRLRRDRRARPGETSPYGMRGNSIVRYADETYDNLVLVGGFSKAYSSLLAFIACPTDVKQMLKVAASPYLYSGPSPVASLATVLAGFDVNEQRGDALRARLHALTARLLDGLARLDIATPNRSGLPIIEIPLRDHRQIAEVGRFLFEQGVYVTLAAYPLVPKAEVGFRFQLTAANTEEEVDTALEALGELAERGLLCSQADAIGTLVPATDMRRPPAWMAYLAFGAVLTVAYVLVPPFRGSGPVMNLLGLSPVVAIFVGVRMHRPRSIAPWTLVRRRLRAVLARRPLHVQLPAAARAATSRSLRSATAPTCSFTPC